MDNAVQTMNDDALFAMIMKENMGDDAKKENMGDDAGKCGDDEEKKRHWVRRSARKRCEKKEEKSEEPCVLDSAKTKSKRKCDKWTIEEQNSFFTGMDMYKR